MVKGGMLQYFSGIFIIHFSDSTLIYLERLVATLNKNNIVSDIEQKVSEYGILQGLHHGGMSRVIAIRKPFS